MKLKILILSFLAVFLMAGSAMAIPTVDGVFEASEYSSVFAEDQNTWWVGPGVGGQDYDVEYLGLSITSTKLYFGLQTGIALKHGLAETSGSRRPGDIALDIGNDGTYDYGIRVWDINFGLLYANNGWLDLQYSQHSISYPWRVDTGSDVTGGLGSYQIAFDDGSALDDFGNVTYVVEGWIMLSDLGLSGFNEPITASFTSYCGNDYGRATVPEPSTMLLFGTGLLGLAAIGRKKLFKK